MSAYISEDSKEFVTLACDSTDSRYARASRINALRRKLEAERGVQLERFATTRSETSGFMHQTAFRYRVTRPDTDDSAPQHVGYPHTPGYLYDCPACEATCHCTGDDALTNCVADEHDNPNQPDDDDEPACAFGNSAMHISVDCEDCAKDAAAGRVTKALSISRAAGYAPDDIAVRNYITEHEANNPPSRNPINPVEGKAGADFAPTAYAEKAANPKGSAVVRKTVVFDHIVNLGMCESRQTRFHWRSVEYTGGV